MWGPTGVSGWDHNSALKPSDHPEANTGEWFQTAFVYIYVVYLLFCERVCFSSQRSKIDYIPTVSSDIFLPAAQRHGHKEGGIVGVGVVGTFRSCSLFLHGKPQDLE